MRIVFLGAFFQVVRTTALLPWQRCQGNSFCDQYEILEFQATYHGRWAVTTTGVCLICQRVYSFEGALHRKLLLHKKGGFCTKSLTLFLSAKSIRSIVKPIQVFGSGLF
jgi:hypothetical protein